MRRLYMYATLVVLAHAAVVFWHLLTHTRIASPLEPNLAMVYAILVGLLPLNALLALWANYTKWGGWLLLLFFAMPLAIFGYEHFLNMGSRNVFHIAPLEAAPTFQVSAVLLVVFEVLGCWVGIQILRRASRSGMNA
jgi:hypothetical protein